MEAGQCVSCEQYGREDSLEAESGIPEKCPESKRPCGHHCNHIWTHDSCCWCGVEIKQEAY